MKSSSIRIEPAVGRKKLSQWIRFPYEIYPKGSNWVAPLERDLKAKISPKKNPFLKHGAACPYLALDEDGKVLGRILAHVDFKHMAYNADEVGFFGYFECKDDAGAAKALIDAAGDFARQHGCKLLKGPFNMNAYQELGIVLDGFDEPQCIADTMTAPYYPSLLEAAGLTICKRMHTVINNKLEALNAERFLTDSARALMKDPAFSIRSIDLSRFKQEMVVFCDLYNECFRGGWYFTPRTIEELIFEMAPAKSIIRPELVLVAELNGVPVGFVISLPDVYPLLEPLRGRFSILGLFRALWRVKSLRRFQFMTMAALPKLRKLGITSALIYKGTCVAKELGFTSYSGTWASDDNVAAMMVHKAGKVVTKHNLAIFEKPLEIG